ncbi:hypothetical protein [Malaciobacter molluscorum]|uniref:hypothetical protein n=1 Tax=Malaciobacter molluscorum TaxID=1032072 RepID=UPI00100A6607|nr:hypothetical protein [Malaciobacter molluscorum]
MYRFNYYIKYEVLELLFRLKNPIGTINKYICANKILEFKNKRFYFKDKFIYKTNKRRFIYQLLLMSMSIISFIFFFLMFAFIPSGENISEIIFFIFYQIVFLMGITLIPRDIDRIKKAEELIEIVNNSNK